MILALMRSAASLREGRVWWALFAPALVGLSLGITAATYWLPGLVDVLGAQPPLAWIADWGWPGVARTFSWLGALLIMHAGIYLVATLVAGVLVLPWLLAMVAERDYPDLARLGRNDWFAGLWNGLFAAAAYLVGWLITLPLWLVPGMALVLPLFWLAWYNRRTFARDALCAHATDAEAASLGQRHGVPLLLLGAVPAILAHVPLVGLVAPGFAALAFVHYSLQALRDLRGDSVGVF